MTFADLVEQATPEAKEVAEQVLREDIANQRWAAQVGPSLTRAGAAKLLGKSQQAVAKDSGLLTVHVTGRVLYPLAQFDGSRPVSGLDQVLELLAQSEDDEWAILSWLTAQRRGLAGRSALHALRDGDTGRVLQLAQDWAHASR